MSSSATELRERLEKLVWLLVPMAREGSDLIGLGEIIDALRGFASDGAEHEIAINVGITLGFRHKDGGIETGALYTARVSDEGVEFDVTETYYESGLVPITRASAQASSNGVANFVVNQWIGSRARRGSSVMPPSRSGYHATTSISGLSQERGATGAPANDCLGRICQARLPINAKDRNRA